MTQYPIQSHYPTTELSPLLLMLSSDKYQIYKIIGLTSLGIKLSISHTRGPRSTDLATAPVFSVGAVFFASEMYPSVNLFCQC